VTRERESAPDRIADWFTEPAVRTICEIGYTTMGKPGDLVQLDVCSCSIEMTVTKRPGDGDGDRDGMKRARK
jgi:hypothetical protein